MKRIIINKIGNRLNIIGILLAIVLLSLKCEGLQSIYLFNCSDDIAIVKSSSSDNHWQLAPIRHYKNNSRKRQLTPSDTFSLKQRIDYWQRVYSTKGNIEITGDTLSIVLKQGEGLQIACKDWLFSPSKFIDYGLKFNNLTIITKSDTCTARNRKEILMLLDDKRFVNDKHCRDKVKANTRELTILIIK